MIRFLASLPFLVCAGLPAQASATSPAGFLNTAGGATQSLGTDTGGFFPFTIQRAQIDATVIGSPRSIGTIHLRRSAIAPADPAYAAQNVMVTVRMAHGDFSAVTGSNQTLQSLLTSSWTTVVQPRSLSLPDLTNPPATPPAPWNVPITLDAPFAYNGTDALVWQINLWSSSMSLPVPLDAVNESFVASTGSAYGTGCQSTQGPFTAFAQFRVQTDGSPTAIDVRSAPGLPAFGTSSLNLMTVGFAPANTPTGLCTALTNSHDVVVPLPTNSFGGGETWNVPSGGSLTVPHDPNWIGIELFVQGWSIELSNPGVLIGSESYRSGPYPSPLQNPMAVASSSSASAGSPGPSFSDNGTFAIGAGLIVGLEP